MNQAHLVAFGVLELRHLLVVLVVDVLPEIVLAFELLGTERASEGCLTPALPRT